MLSTLKIYSFLHNFYWKLSTCMYVLVNNMEKEENICCQSSAIFTVYFSATVIVTYEL